MSQAKYRCYDYALANKYRYRANYFLVTPRSP